MSKRAPLPATTHSIATLAEAKPLDCAADALTCSETTIRSIDIAHEIQPVQGLPSPVPLFTLHAALLI